MFLSFFLSLIVFTIPSPQITIWWPSPFLSLSWKMIVCGRVIIYCLIYMFTEINLLCKVDKAYPRDFMQRGRVRVLLKREDGTLVNPAISSSKDRFYFLKSICWISYSLFLFVCLMCYLVLFPKLLVSLGACLVIVKTMGKGRRVEVGVDPISSFINWKFWAIFLIWPLWICNKFEAQTQNYKVASF